MGNHASKNAYSNHRNIYALTRKVVPVTRQQTGVSNDDGYGHKGKSNTEAMVTLVRRKPWLR